MLQAIVQELRDEVFRFPTTPEEWRSLAEEFGRRWNFHHCVGALDGKHVAIRAPHTSGTLFHNYKGYFSTVILALADADYKFIWADVGSQGEKDIQEGALILCCRSATHKSLGLKCFFIL